MAGEIRRRKRTVYLCPVERDGATITEQQSERLAWEGALERVNQESVNPSSLATVAESWRARLWPEHIEMTLKHVGERHHRYIGKRLLERMGALMLREVIHKHTQALVAEAARGGLGGQTLTHPRNAVGALLRHAQCADSITA